MRSETFENSQLNLIDDFSEEEVENESKKDHDTSSEIKVEINIEDLLEESYVDRANLKKEIDTWAAKNKMQLKFKTQERETLEGIKVSVLHCRKKEALGCQFYLHFTKFSIDSKYKLENYWNIHNHILPKYHSAYAMTPQIYQRIKSLREITTDCGKISKSINEEFKTEFNPKIIYHQLQKIKEEEYGKSSQDAENFISMLKKDAAEREFFLAKKPLIIPSNIVAIYRKE